MVENLTKVYHGRGRAPVVAVDDVSFSVHRNQVVGLLGPNGAGKTSIIKSLCAILRPSVGAIHVDGIDLLRHPYRALRKITAVLEGNRNIYWRLTPRENMEFFAGLQGISACKSRPYIAHLLHLFRLEEKQNALAQDLSRGMQQKLVLATTLVKQTDVLLLDEPTLGLDVETSYELRDILKRLAKEEDRTILLSSHDMHVVQDVCDRVIIIHNGRIVRDDHVDHLLNSFRSHSYEFIVRGLTPEAQRQLQQQFIVRQLYSEASLSKLQVDLKNSSQIYEFIALLQQAHCHLESVETSQHQLEAVFLKILQKEQ